MADTEILLESGTNEIEIMQFTINDELYGINVAKVREIMMADKVKPIPHAHNAVEGIFKPREILLTVVDLPKYLTKQECEKHPRDLFIVTNFNKMHIAFRVHRVVGISRISWTDIQKPDNTISHGDEGVATGIAQCGDNLVTILDFENCGGDRSGDRNPGGRDHKDGKTFRAAGKDRFSGRFHFADQNDHGFPGKGRLYECDQF